MSSTTKVLVVGATGATGKHVVQMMLDQGHHVIALCRSKESMLKKLNDKTDMDRLEIYEASITQMDHNQLVSLTKDCDYVVSCLGHNMTFKAVFLKDRRLVRDACKKLTTAMPANCKFLLMGSDGVAQKGVDPKRKFGERTVLFLLRHLLPPHVDNEKAAAFLLNADKNDLDWVIVRPTNLVDAEEASGKYTISEKAEASLFGDTFISRNDVGHFFVELMTTEETYTKYQHKMPVIVGIPEEKAPGQYNSE
jgi:putative NADH-flavin reductase